MIECPKRFYGKYRGTVVNNVDPMQIGRLLVNVPDVSNFLPSTWAMPCSAVGGMQTGVYTVPPIGAGVWVEFEQGDLSYPVWTGCFWGTAAEVPAMALAAPPALPPIVIQSIAQNRIVISSVPGDGIRLETAAGPGGPSITINAAGIIISDGVGGMITLTGGAVTINQGALFIK